MHVRCFSNEKTFQLPELTKFVFLQRRHLNPNLDFMRLYAPDTIPRINGPRIKFKNMKTIRDIALICNKSKIIEHCSLGNRFSNANGFYLRA